MQPTQDRPTVCFVVERDIILDSQQHIQAYIDAVIDKLKDRVSFKIVIVGPEMVYMSNDLCSEPPCALGESLQLLDRQLDETSYVGPAEVFILLRSMPSEGWIDVARSLRRREVRFNIWNLNPTVDDYWLRQAKVLRGGIIDEGEKRLVNIGVKDRARINSLFDDLSSKLKSLMSRSQKVVYRTSPEQSASKEKRDAELSINPQLHQPVTSPPPPSGTKVAPIEAQDAEEKPQIQSHKAHRELTPVQGSLPDQVREQPGGEHLDRSPEVSRPEVDVDPVERSEVQHIQVSKTELELERASLPPAGMVRSESAEVSPQPEAGEEEAHVSEDDGGDYPYSATDELAGSDQAQQTDLEVRKEVEEGGLVIKNISPSDQDQPEESDETTEETPEPSPPPVREDGTATIWKDLDPPAEMGDRVDHFLKDTLHHDNWTMIGASRRGKLHAHKGIFREDHFEIDIESDWYMMVVADGGGSCPLSRVGSVLASQAAIDEMKYYINSMADDAGDDIERLEDLCRITLQQGMLKAWKSLWAEAQSREVPLKHFGTTFLAVLYHEVADESILGVLQVGDGLVAARFADGELRALAEPDVGETAGATYFLTSKDSKEWLDRAEVFHEQVRVDMLTAMCDGVADDFIPFSKHLPTLFGGLQDVIKQEQPDQALLDLLAYEKRGSFDDRTLTLLYRRSIIEEQEDSEPQVEQESLEESEVQAEQELEDQELVGESEAREEQESEDQVPQEDVGSQRDQGAQEVSQTQGDERLERAPEVQEDEGRDRQKVVSSDKDQDKGPATDRSKRRFGRGPRSKRGGIGRRDSKE